MKGLTKKQREIVDYIEQFIAAHRYAPSYREISSHFGFRSIASAFKHVTCLKQKGVITKDGKTPRSIAIAKDSPSPQIDLHRKVSIPLIGTISGKDLIHTYSETEELSIPTSILHYNEKIYALKVQDNSFNEELIGQGDLLMIESRQNPAVGEVVIAMVALTGIMIKKYFTENDKTTLCGCYQDHLPIVLNREDVKIHGILIGIIRKY